jgi:predicted anti-sigma-YlaC factor YlaD
VNADRCPREGELLDAFALGYVGPELEEHAAACASCRELHVVAAALRGERAQAITEAPVPSAAAMRFRMQIRLRQEAQAAARRWLLAGQAATLMIAAALIASFFGVDVATRAREVIAAVRLSTPLLVLLATWLLLAPIAGYVAIRQK